MRRLLAFVVLVAAGLAALLATGAGGERQGKSYEVVFDNVFGLVEGGDLKIGGVRAGVITGFRLTDTEPRKVAVKIDVTQPGFDAFRSDASCDVRNQSLIGEYFVDCQLGTEAGRLRDGGTVSVKRTTSTIPPDLIANVMRRPYRERFRLIISELGVGLAGRSEELNEVIRRAHPGLKEVNETLAILARQNRTLRDFIEDSDTVSAAVEPRKKEVSRWAQEASETAAVQASRAESLKAQWNRLPGFLGELRPTLRRLDATAGEQIQFLRSMQSAAPDLQRFLTALRPFARAARRSQRRLGPAARVGLQAVRESREEIAELRELAGKAPRLAKPLRQFLQTIDDRGRAIESDPLAGQLAPPAPDKTSSRSGKGFTGMESFWNYIYWQTLGTNGFDEVSKYLRIALLRSDCSNYASKPEPDIIAECNSYAGPYQPCVTNPKKLVVNGKDLCSQQALTATSRRGRDAGAGLGDRRGPGQPEAPPKPGQRDISKPQVTLPPELQNLIERLTPRPLADRLPGAAPGGGGPRGGTELLDYLLAP